jgi:hypothetical protein
MSEIEFHPCPICSSPVQHWTRYPQAICQDCAAKARNAQGRKLTFYNYSASGGFYAVVEGSGAKNEEHLCYIDGLECWADEHWFGGIVIQPYEGLREEIG